jgi:PTH1 family peptidyl-tRNA hydrolase
MTSALCFAGLGNPGSQYKDNRHNLGAQFIERLSKTLGIELQVHPKSKVLSAVLSLGAKKIHLIIPQSYMNNSGLPIAQYLHFYKIEPQSLVVVHDELDFESGQMRIKLSGGHGGHNGLRSIHQHLNTNEYKRIRLGIGHPGSKDKVAHYVLSRPSLDEEIMIELLFKKMIECWPSFAEESWEKLTALFHKNEAIK